MRRHQRMDDTGSPCLTIDQKRATSTSNTARTRAPAYEFAAIAYARKPSEIPPALLSLARKRDDLQLIVVTRACDESESVSSKIEFLTDAAITSEAEGWNRGLTLARARWIRFIRMDESASIFLPERALQRIPFTHAAAIIESNRTAIITQRELDSIRPFSSVIWFNRDVLAESGLRFEKAVRRSFAPRSVLLSLLAANPALALASVRTRRRHPYQAPDMDEWRDPAIYTDGIRCAYLSPLERAASVRGVVPGWFGRVILEDLIQYFERDRRTRSPTTVASDGQRRQFHSLVSQVLGHIDAATIAALDVDHELRCAVLAYKDLVLPPQPRIREHRGPGTSVLVEYEYGGTLPPERLQCGRIQLTPTCTKIQAVRFFDRTLLRRRFLWVDVPPGETLCIHLGGVEHFLPVEPAKSPLRSWRATVLEWIAALPPVRRRFASAWALSDRWDEADDNAEHLYRWIRANRPDINAWFVLGKCSPDWTRLANEGFRIVSSRQMARLLYLNSEHVVSSQPAMLSLALALRRRRAAPFPRRTYLRHGTAEKDQSHWLNEGDFDLVLASSPAEYRAIAGDESPYAYTPKHVALTGLARHDRLVRLRDRFPPEQRTAVVVMPTWRASLAKTVRERSPIARVPADLLGDTDYVKNWSSLLNSTSLREALSSAGKDLLFFPHPDLVPHLALFKVPPWVCTVRKATSSFQDIFLQAALLITDFSSIAFEMALLRRPVIYFQFDRHAFYHGDHNWRPGHFEYEKDGFGPITTTVEGVVTHVRAVLHRDGEVDQNYLERMQSAMPLDDGLACERSFEAIRRLTR